jgi:hypothetical protein
VTEHVRPPKTSADSWQRLDTVANAVLLKFALRCWARGYLAHVGEITLQEAVDVLQADAKASGLVEALGQDAVQRIIAEGFSEAAAP